MKKLLALSLTACLAFTTLTACGSNSNDDEIVKIDAVNKAGDATGQEREREDTNKEPVVCTDQKQEETTSEDINQQQEQSAPFNILGYWFDNSRNSFQFFHEDDDTETIYLTGSLEYGAAWLYGEATTDNKTFIEVTQEIQNTIVEQPTPEPTNPDEEPIRK